MGESTSLRSLSLLCSRQNLDHALMSPEVWLDQEAINVQRRSPLFLDVVGFLVHAGLLQYTQQLVARCHEFHTKFVHAT